MSAPESDAFVELIPCEVELSADKVSARLSKLHLTLSFAQGKLPPKLDYITFRNFYTSYITVKQLIHTPEHTMMWRTVLHRHRLMADAHFEDDAQSSHVLRAEDFNDKFEPDRVSVLRVYLYQPSPLWGSYSLKNVECHSIVHASVATNQSEALLDDLSSLATLSLDLKPSPSPSSPPGPAVSASGAAVTQPQIVAAGKRCAEAISNVLRSLHRLKQSGLEGGS
jgi:hypothetical protein